MLIGCQFKDMDTERLVKPEKKPSLTFRLFHFILRVFRSVFWHPHDRGDQQKEDENRFLEKQIKIFQQLGYLERARADFNEMLEKVLLDKEKIQEKMEDRRQKLEDKRTDYFEAKENNLPVETILSDTMLLLSNFERYKKLYILQNDILNLIDRTLTDTDVTQKIASLCGTVSRTEYLGSSNYSGFEDTMYQLINHIAKCDETKSYITSQLSLATSNNIDTALRVGIHVEDTQAQSNVMQYLDSGKLEKEEKKVMLPS